MNATTQSILPTTLATSEESPDTRRDPQTLARPSRRALGIGLAAVTVAAAAGAWYAYARHHESTDDAQLDADVVAVPSRIAGTIAHVYITDNQHVKEGDVLAALDSDIAEARVAQSQAELAAAIATADAADADARVAEANANGNKAATAAGFQSSAAAASVARDQIAEAEAARSSAEATLHQAQIDVGRYRQLYAADAVPKAVLDQNETALAVARSNLNATQARVVTMRLFSTLSPDTGGDDLLLPNMVRGVGTVLMFLPLQLAALGPIPKAEVSAASGFFNLTRQLGGSIGVALLTTMLDKRTTFHRAVLAENLTAGDPRTLDRIGALTRSLVEQGQDLETARRAALALLDRTLNLQASVMSFSDTFLATGAVLLVALPLVFLLGKPPAGAKVSMGH
jgi:multidrug efflux pump subunit AcrA (membrane-fusion protein)